MVASSHHYLFDVVPLLDDCIEKLQKTIDKGSRSRHDALYGMKEILVYTERLLHQYLVQMIEKESRTLSRAVPPYGYSSTIQQTLNDFKHVLEEKRLQEESNERKTRFLNPQDPLPVQPIRKLYTHRSATDSLLFRLIVALQLCLLRIDDAHFVLTGHRIQPDDQQKGQQRQQMALTIGMGCCCLIGAGAAAISWSGRSRNEWNRWMIEFLPNDRDAWRRTLVSGVAATVAGRIINTQWKMLWMRDKIFKSTCEIDEWTRQWETVQTSVSPMSQTEQWHQEQLRLDLERQISPPGHPCSPDLMDDKSRRLIEYAMKHSAKSYCWQSQGEIRFLMLKRFMDVYYASVGTALDSSSSSPKSKWIVPLVTGAAASFYSITGTGASLKASYTINHASRDLIQHAW